jgi:hypothetical protein
MRLQRRLREGRAPLFELSAACSLVVREALRDG